MSIDSVLAGYMSPIWYNGFYIIPERQGSLKVFHAINIATRLIVFLLVLWQLRDICV